MGTGLLLWSQTFFKEMPKPETRLSLDFSSLLGPLFFVWVLGLPLPVMMQSLVYEKENRLRVMMRMHGLSSNTYWLVSYLWWITVTFFYSLFLMIFGAVIGLNFFAGNDFLLQIVFYITLQHAQVTAARSLAST